MNLDPIIIWIDIPKLVRARNDEYLFNQDTYQTLVGCLIYLSTKKKELTLPMLSEMLQKIH